MHLNAAFAAALLATGAAPGVSAQLNQLAQAAGKKYFGSAVDNSELSDQQLLKYLSNKNEFGQTTPGNGQKWQYTEPSRGQFSYGSGDQIADFAKKNGQLLRCHTLVWHSQLPSWVSNGQWTRDTLTSVINTHIANEVGHYKGQCYAWDVEALNEDGTYRKSVFSDVLGDTFFAIAFDAAAKADPNAKLYYNDYNLETLGAKQQGAARIVKLVKSAGKKIDGVGMQAHLIVGQSPSRSTLKSVMQSYVDAGATEVAFTELDIRFPSLPSTSQGLQTQANDYGAVTSACLDIKECVGITIWGFTDAHSWIPGTFPGTGDALLFDKNYNKKPAYSTVSSILAAAATGSPAPGPTTTLQTSTVVSSAPAATTTAAGGCTVAIYGQCGGKDIVAVRRARVARHARSRMTITRSASDRRNEDLKQGDQFDA
ncbi:endo-1-4-beta-xylanase A [Apiospora arundinis]